MTVRIRAIIIIIVTNLFIILFSILSGIGYSRNRVEHFIEKNMIMVANIANRFISDDLDMLKLKAGDIMHNLLASGQAGWPEILAELESLRPEFIGMAVFDDAGKRVASAGEAPASAEVLEDKYIRRVYEGKEALSSTCVLGNTVVFYLGIPMSHEFPSGSNVNYFFIATIPCMYFTDLLADFTVLDTGHVFLLDSEANAISTRHAGWVEERSNIFEMASRDTGFRKMADICNLMMQGESGVGRFTVYGVPRIAAYRPISGSEEGWSLGVSAPLPESPVNDIDVGLALVGTIGLLLNIIFAIIASSFIKKPFEEVAAMKEVAEANSESKSKFLANMSHEMRTPLNAVIGLSDLTLDGKIDGEEKENIKKVYTAGVTLLGIINDILDISKIESGKLELNCVEYDVPSMINDVITLNIMRIDEKPITFKLFVDDDLPAKLFGDDLRVKQIFSNILTNAFKYTRAGVVEWHILSERNGNDVWLISSIKDSGIGIRKEDIGKLFDNYSQVDSSINRGIEGTGLGLSITKYMVELMGGNISVESEYGKGSTFTFRMKQGFISEDYIGSGVADTLRNFKYIDHKHDSHSRLVRLNLSYAKVLVVDDVTTNLAVVKGIMKPYGMQVDCVTSGREAIGLIRKGVKYNAIFMDHMMPEMNGMEATKIIRNDIESEYAKTVPIIALTANAVRGNEEMFLDSGFQAFLSKPIDINKMDAVIRKWVRNKEQEDIAGGETANAGMDTASEKHDQGLINKKIDGVNLELALKQFNNDQETLMAVLRAYIEQTPVMLDKIRVIKPDKLDEYTTTVHGLKGSSRGIYAGSIGDMAEKLEIAGTEKNIAFIQDNNNSLIADAEKLVAAIKVWFNKG